MADVINFARHSPFDVEEEEQPIGPSYLPYRVDQYRDVDAMLEAIEDPLEWKAQVRTWAKQDNFFLLNRVLTQRDWAHPERPEERRFENQETLDLCREIQFDGDGKLIILPRGGGKSHVLAAEDIRTLLKNSSGTVVLFSGIQAIAEKLLKIRTIEFTRAKNQFFYDLFPDVIWKDALECKAAGAVWTKSMIELKRPVHYKDPSIEAVGLIDGSMQSGRATKVDVDDAVNEKTVTTPEMIDKVNEKLSLIHGLGMPGTTFTYLGTHYANGDSYCHLARESGVRVRYRACFAFDKKATTFDQHGLPKQVSYDRSGPTFVFSREYYEAKEQSMSPKQFALQYLCNPMAAEITTFRSAWWRTYSETREKVRKGANCLMLVDSGARAKRNEHSRTAILVLALRPDKRFYLLDGIIYRMELDDRTQEVFDLCAKWEPYEIRYEELGNSSDIGHIEYVERVNSYRLPPIEAVKGNTDKKKNIGKLVPIFSEGRFLAPARIPYIAPDGTPCDLVDQLKTEFLSFPNAKHFDGLDALRRIDEPNLDLRWPKGKPNWDDPRAYKDDAWRAAFFGNAGRGEIGPDDWQAVG